MSLILEVSMSVRADAVNVGDHLDQFGSGRVTVIRVERLSADPRPDLDDGRPPDRWPLISIVTTMGSMVRLPHEMLTVHRDGAA